MPFTYPIREEMAGARFTSVRSSSCPASDDCLTHCSICLKAVERDLATQKAISVAQRGSGV